MYIGKTQTEMIGLKYGSGNKYPEQRKLSSNKNIKSDGPLKND
jgi:hypothetical protein